MSLAALWLAYEGEVPTWRLALLGSQVGSHHRPTSSYVRRTEAFDSRDLAGMKPKSPILVHAKDLVRIGVVRSGVAVRCTLSGFR
jgi:hypothetical protein